MDVDTSLYDQPVDDLALFDLTPEQFPWRSPRPDEILSRRSLMSNELFFDILLELGGIEEPRSLYPPVDVASLQRLLDAIACASYDSMKRSCLIYYLLRWHGDGRESKFADRKCISPHYVAIADAYWHLDTGINLGRAVALFSDARIVKEYVTKTLNTLALSSDSTSLILKYVRCCRPALTDLEDMTKYCLASAEKNFLDAWEYQGQFSDNFEVKQHLLHKLFRWVCTPTLQPKAFQNLLVIPLTPFEETTMRDYATKSQPDLSQASAALLRDLFCVRLIQNSKFVEAVKFDREFPSQNAYTRGSWSFERKRLLKDIVSAMPAVERAMLEMELGRLGSSEKSSSRPPASAINTSSGAGPTHDESSWEDMRPPSSTNGLLQSNNKANGRSVASQYASPRRIPSLSNRTQPSPAINGRLSRQSLFTPGASTSSSRPPVSLLQAPSTPVSGIHTHQHQPLASSSQLSSNVPLIDLSSSISAPSRLASSVINNSNSNMPSTHGLANGTPKSNAFTARNAFFDPPVSHGSVFGARQTPGEQSRAADGRISPPKTTKAAVDDLPSSAPHIEDTDSPGRTGIADALTQDTAAVESEREELGYSLFNGTNNYIPPESPTKARATSEQRLPPGAFIPDAEDREEQTLIEQPHYNLRRLSRTPEETRKSNSRKRAASPENLSMNIPGSLIEENEREEVEEIDDIAPLPTKTKRPARKSRRMSRASSTDVSESESSRPVRRSSRLSTTTSPTSTKAPSARPKKSTRTSGAGATATGRGGSKKR